MIYIDATKSCMISCESGLSKVYSVVSLIIKKVNNLNQLCCVNSLQPQKQGKLLGLLHFIECFIKYLLGLASCYGNFDILLSKELNDHMKI